MKKYDYSVIDFSEIENITSDYTKINETSDKMKTLGMMNDNGSANETKIKQIVNVITVPFFAKLNRRIRHIDGGISAVFLNYSMMVEKSEYIAAYFYIAFLYGFMQWRVPKEISLIPADDNVLECFITEFGKRFSSYMEELLNLSEAN